MRDFSIKHDGPYAYYVADGAGERHSPVSGYFTFAQATRALERLVEKADA